MAVTARHRPLLGVPDSGRGALRALHLTLDGALIALVLVVAAAGASTHLASLAGMEVITIRGRSMEPDIPFGSIVVVRGVDEARVGDVVTYHAGNDVIVTHRVVGTSGTDGVKQLITKGDRNPHADPNPVPTGSVVGRVEFHIPFLGFVAWMLSTPSGVVGILTAFMALLVCLWLVEDVSSDRARVSRLGHQAL